jgi:hypothetical protein
MQMLMTGAFFFGLTFVTRGIIVARHWQTRSLLPLGLVLAGSVPCSVLAAWIGLGIEGVAAVTSLSLAALLLVLLGFLRRMAGPDVLDWRRLYRLVALPGAVMFALLGGYRLLAGARWLEPWPCIIGGAIYMILAALLAYWAVRRFPELSGLRLLGRGAGREDT